MQNNDGSGSKIHFFRLDGETIACAHIDEFFRPTELFQKNKTEKGGLLSKNTKTDIIIIYEFRPMRCRENSWNFTNNMILKSKVRAFVR